MDNDDVIDALNKLIETCKDGEYGFRTSAEHLKTPDLKQLFIRRADECRQGAAELQQLVAQHGGTAEDSGTASGALHRGWVSVKATLAGYSEKAILEEIERGEDVAMDAYRNCLEKDLPANVLTVGQRQFEGVKRNHAQVRELHNQARAAAD